MNEAKYKRVLLKLSGESLMGAQQYGIDLHGSTTMRQTSKQPRAWAYK